MILKTVATHFPLIEKFIQEKCSYEVPEIAAVPASEVSPSYLAWVISETIV